MNTKSDPAYAQTIRYVMLRMIALGGGELARRRVLLSELEYPSPENERVKKVIKNFSAARLLVEGQDVESNPYVEPAHDALVRGWQKLLLWKQEEEESLLLQRRLTSAAEEWKSLADTKLRSSWRTQTEPLLNWVDARLYSAENSLNKIKVELLKLIRGMSPEQNLLREKPEQFLWNTNPYLNVLKTKLISSHNWFNQIEAEFVQQSLKRKRIISRRLIAFVIIVMSALSVLTTIVAQRSEKKANYNLKLAEKAREKRMRAEQKLEATIKNSNLALNKLKTALANRTISRVIAAKLG